MSSTPRPQVTVVIQDGVTHRIDAADLPTIPRLNMDLSLAAAIPASMLVYSDSPTIGLLDPDSEIVYATGIAHGTAKRLKPDALVRDEWEVITLEDGDRLVGFTPSTDSSDLVFISSDAQLPYTPANRARPQGRTASDIAGMKLLGTAKAISFWVANSIEDSLVVTVIAAGGALPGSGQIIVKIIPFTLYPSKGRGGQGMRAQHFLRGENRLDLAWIGPRLTRVTSAEGSPIDLPAEDKRQDVSGTSIIASIDSLG